MIDVLIVEDSPSARELLAYILGSDPDLRVVGVAHTGEEALQMAERLRPHVITMDIHLPSMDGFEATRRIMQQTPTPVVVVSGSSSREETAWAFRAVEAGALAVVRKPSGPASVDFEHTREQLLRMVKLMAEVKVVRRWASHSRGANQTALVTPSVSLKAEPVELVAIGASTGGPPVLQKILSGLPGDFFLPVVIVQHMSPGFMEGFAEWLAQYCPLQVQIGKQGVPLRPGNVYLAPDNRDLRVNEAKRLVLTDDPPRNGLRPSVSHLFRSVAEIYGPRAAGVLLTGMGKDGAEELKIMRERGAITIAQNQETSVVFGMPGEAVRLDAANYVLSPEQITSFLVALSRRQAKQSTSVESR